MFLKQFACCVVMSLTLQPCGVILLSANDVTATKTTEEGRVPAHEVRCDASIQFPICSKKHNDLEKKWFQTKEQSLKRKGCSFHSKISDSQINCDINIVRTRIFKAGDA